LSLKCDILVSKCAFKCNLYRYAAAIAGIAYFFTQSKKAKQGGGSGVSGGGGGGGAAEGGMSDDMPAYSGEAGDNVPVGAGAFAGGGAVQVQSILPIARKRLVSQPLLAL
jgi:hypothetical protein